MDSQLQIRYGKIWLKVFLNINYLVVFLNIQNFEYGPKNGQSFQVKTQNWSEESLLNILPIHDFVVWDQAAQTYASLFY